MKIWWTFIKTKKFIYLKPMRLLKRRLGRNTSVVFSTVNICAVFKLNRSRFALSNIVILDVSVINLAKMAKINK